MQEIPSSPHHSLSAQLREATKDFVNVIAGGLVRLGFGPDALTVIGVALAGIAGWLAANGAYGRAGVVYLLSGPFDAVDGAVARVSGRASRFGALLDSTLDRYGEGLLLTGLGYHLAQQGAWIGLVLTFVSLIGSYMVSYVRARSETLGIKNEVGLMTRMERFVVVAVALLSGQVIIGLWVLAVLTQITVAQRVWHTYRSTREGN